MFLTEKEILDTPNALAKTVKYFAEKREEIDQFFSERRERKFSVFGCGSSYMLAKSVAAVLQTYPDTSACAIPAGDFIVDPENWKETVRGSIIISLSRSGRTSEVVRAIKYIKDEFGCAVISLSMEDGNDIMPMSELDITMDWCYDRSVCQTRTVTNLYAASLLLAAAYANDEKLRISVEHACEGSGEFQSGNRPALEELAKIDWDNVVVLADGPVCGIAEEGALAFTEIAMLSGRYFHLLDYRHGPIVVSGKKTLTLILLRPNEDKYQPAMVKDVIGHCGPVVTVSERPGNPYGATAHLQVKDIAHYAAWGIPFIFVAQMVSLLKAIDLGGNPDAPTGLDAYITLS